MIEKIKFFTRESKAYMDCKKNPIYFWVNYPRALVRFLWFSRND
jgi:hypothetical protein